MGANLFTHPCSVLTGHEHGRYGGGYMQANPSYRGYGGEQSGHQGYTTGGYGSYSARRDVDINEPYAYYPSGGGGGSRVGEGGRYGTTATGGTARRRAVGGSYRTSGDGLQSTSDFEYHHYTGALHVDFISEEYAIVEHGSTIQFQNWVTSRTE